MLLWISFAALTAAVVAFLLRPLWGGAGAGVDASSADVAVYRDQLDEIEAERDRGLLSNDEFEGARVEIARRLIKRAGDAKAHSDPAADGAVHEPASRPRSGLGYAIGALLPAIAIAIYLASGSPELGGQPHLARMQAPVQGAPVMDIIGRVEQRLREHPEDGQGWDVIAPVYLRLGRYSDAAHAYGEASRLLGESVKRLVGFSEATLMVNNGVVTDAVRGASERILQLEPGRIEARIWLVLAKEQDGDLAGAKHAYQDILETAPKDAPWREALTERVAELGKRISGEAPLPAARPSGDAQAKPAAQPRGPDAADVARAEDMSPADREAFIARMVDNLAERLKADGKDLDGWIRLLRAYKVLGRDSDALAALGSARQNFTGDEKSLGQLDEAAKTLGLGS